MDKHKENETAEQLHALELSDEALSAIVGGRVEHKDNEGHGHERRGWEHGRGCEHERHWRWFHHHRGLLGGLI